MRRCLECKERKPLRKFSLVRSGRGKRSRRKRCEKCRGSKKYRKHIQSRYDRSLKGKARWLRKDHGYGDDDALHLAAILLDPYTRCTICGVPRRWLRSFHHRGYKGLHWRGLSVDHIRAGGPSTLANTRILCRTCNSIRGAEYHTDIEVLLKTRNWYEYRGFSARDLWWLHTSPGKDGMDRLGTKRIHPND